MKQFWVICLTVLIASLSGCGSNKKNHSTKTILTNAEDVFESGNYADALTGFIKAVNADPNSARALNGLGWCYLKLNNLDDAIAAFENASLKMDTPADVFAGWGFALNAKKDYTQSNTKITQALTLNSAWEFIYGLGLDAVDLHIQKAANHYLLLQYDLSLAEIKIVNTSFSLTSVTSNLDKSLLAKEIERLRTINKSAQ